MSYPTSSEFGWRQPPQTSYESVPPGVLFAGGSALESVSPPSSRLSNPLCPRPHPFPSWLPCRFVTGPGPIVSNFRFNSFFCLASASCWCDAAQDRWSRFASISVSLLMMQFAQTILSSAASDFMAIRPHPNKIFAGVADHLETDRKI